MVLNWFGKRNCVICYVIFVFWWSMGNDQHVCIFCWQITWIITLLFNRTLSHVTDRYRFFFLMKTVSYNSLSLQNIWWNYNMPNQTVLHFEQSWSKNGTETDLSILKNYMCMSTAVFIKWKSLVNLTMIIANLGILNY